MDTSIRIRTHFEANSREQWELGHKLFQQDLQGARFWNQVGVAIRKQAKRMGVPARQLKYHDIVVKLEHIAADLQSIRTDFADEQSASKIPSFVLFMRKYRPSEDPTWDIWKYVLDRRIVPALVRGSAEQMVAKSMSLDADVHPPPVIAPNPTDDSDATCEAIQESILSKLNPRDRAIFLMTYWSLQSESEKNKHRPMIISTGAQECFKQDSTSHEPLTLDRWIVQKTTLFASAEESLSSAKAEDQSRAVELQESMSLHYNGAVCSEKAKSKFAERFLAQGGVRNIRSVSSDKEQEPESYTVEPLSPLWQKDAKLLLLTICRQAVECKSYESYLEQFKADFPLTIIYKDYKPNHGAPKRRNNALWMLMRFGGHCQSQSYHLNAYRSKEVEFSQMKSALGFSDKTIGEILGISANYVAVRRNRYRDDLMKQMDSSPALVSEAARDKQVPPTIDIVCSEFNA